MEEQPISPLQEAYIRTQEEAQYGEEMASQKRSSDPALAEAFSFGYSEFGYEMSVRALDVYQALNRMRAPLAFAEAQGAKVALIDTLYMRRDRLEHSASMLAAKWAKKLATLLPIDTLYKALTSTTDKDIQSSVLAILVGLLAEYPDLAREIKSIVADAHAKAVAEGTVSAGSILNQHKGHKVPDIVNTHKTQLAKAKTSSAYWTGSDTTVAQILQGLAGDLVIGIGHKIKEKLKEEAIKAAIAHIISSGAGAKFYMGAAVHLFYANAQKDYLHSAGEKIDFVTVGDSRVCPMCISAEEGNPYTVSDLPVIPQHGGCRCWYTPAGAL